MRPEAAGGWRPTASREAIHLRAALLRDIRAFFERRGVIEVETPLLSTAATTDPNLTSFTLQYRQQPLYLSTSPEFGMKRLLAAYGEPIFQVCKSFRDDELGPNHNPEFTMLEWYRPGFSMFELMDELGELVQELASKYGRGSAPIRRLSYAEAFMRAVGIDPHTASAEDCRACARRHDIEQPVGLEGELDAWLDWLMVARVAPSFPSDAFTFIYDYPRSQAALAKLHDNRDGHTVAARFELFHGEIELANGFDELLDADEQRDRFEQENAARVSTGKQPVVIDERLLKALEHGLPDCSGVALGLDRLLMLFSDSHILEQVLAFSFPAN